MARWGRLKGAWQVGQQLKTASGEFAVTPWEALLLEVRRSAYRSAWVDQRLDDEVTRERQLTHESEESDRRTAAAEVRKWLDQSRRERMHLARISKAAIDAGLAERYVHGIEVEARLIAGVLDRALRAIELTPAQKDAIRPALREALREASLELHRRHAAIEGHAAEVVPPPPTPDASTDSAG